MPRFLSPEWLAEIKERLAEDEKFRYYAYRWKGTARVEVPDAPGGAAAITIEVQDGELIRADRDPGRDIIWSLLGPLDVWQQILAGEKDPIRPVFESEIEFQGDVDQFMRNLPAIKYLFLKMREIETSFD
jgi:hypothetical protein